jgi:heme A synthase
MKRRLMAMLGLLLIATLVLAALRRRRADACACRAGG